MIMVFWKGKVITNENGNCQSKNYSGCNDAKYTICKVNIGTVIYVTITLRNIIFVNFTLELLLMKMVIVKVRIIAVVTMRNILFVNFTLEL